MATALVALGCVGGTVAVAAGGRSVAQAAAKRGLSVTFRFTQTDAGTQHGATTIGVKGHGTFSATLGAHASDLALIALATGIPFDEIARGGSFGVNFTIGPTGTNTGTVMARFKAKGLGSVCFGFTAKGGPFQPGDSFVPTTGKMKVLGGTGAAAGWNADATYSLRAISGSSIESFRFSGTAHGTIAKKRPLNATCKRVAALSRG
jgi:hypothetical protein